MKLILKLTKQNAIERNNDDTDKKKERISEWITFLGEKQKCNPNLDCTLEIEI